MCLGRLPSALSLGPVSEVAGPCVRVLACMDVLFSASCHNHHVTVDLYTFEKVYFSSSMKMNYYKN